MSASDEVEMASDAFLEYKALVSEINDGLGQVKQLRASSSGDEERVLERMSASYEEALLILNGFVSEGRAQSVISSSSDPVESLMCGSGDTRQAESSRGSYHPQIDKSLKREGSSQSREKVIVRSEGLDDGYGWRKYGKKEILGAPYPRGYYRCVHRHVQGCMATKQVQRLGDDPSSYEIVYRGRHTCRAADDLSAQPASSN